jgi:hypothetical protein
MPVIAGATWDKEASHVRASSSHAARFFVRFRASRPEIYARRVESTAAPRVSDVQPPEYRQSRRNEFQALSVTWDFHIGRIWDTFGRFQVLHRWRR